jgi:predicted amidohydrolase YtcJ
MRTLITSDAVVSAAGTVGNAIAIDDGLIAAIGDRSDIERSGDRVLAFDGAFVSAGFRDAHIHAIPYAALLSGCSLKSAVSIDDLVDRLATFARSVRPGYPIVATRFDDESLREHRLPTREDLDRAVPDRPAVIYRYCGHVAVANSKALAASHIDESVPDPDGGLIDRDERGEPTGVLRETATGLISSALARGDALAPNRLVDGMTKLAGLGITSIGAMVGYGESPFEKLAAESQLWREVAPDLPIKVHALSIASTPDDLTASAQMMTGAGQRLRWLGVKRFADGSLGGHTAAMCDPFSDSGTTGTYRLTDADIEVSRHSLALGGMVAIHAIGDRAVSSVLDVFEGLIAAGSHSEDLRMEHVSMASPSVIARFAASGATAVVQPAFLASESEWIEARVGEERMEWVYPFKAMLDSGIKVAGSSDCIVEPPHPLWGIAAAMDRHGINPNEALSGRQALGLFTEGAAGSIRERPPMAIGSAADLVVVDTNITAASPQEVRDAQVIETFVDGNAVAVDRELPVWVD